LGKLLALDGKVMLTERDERFYHEMLVHPPMLSHQKPKRVLVIGGGDGGAVREVVRHPSVDEVLWVEIDEEVVEACRKHLPEICAGVFENAKVKLHIAPGEEFTSKLSKEEDVIIVDSTDPIGPAVQLFSRPFFENCKRALREGGLFCTQCGTPFYFSDEVKSVHAHLRQLFPNVRLYLGFVPSYPSGMWAYCMASDAPVSLTASDITQRVRERGLTLSYFTPDIYFASAVLPQFVNDLLES